MQKCDDNKYDRRNRKRESEKNNKDHHKKKGSKNSGHHDKERRHFFGTAKRNLAVVYTDEGARVIGAGSKIAKHDRLNRGYCSEEDCMRFTAILNFTNVDWRHDLIYHFRWDYKSFRLIISNGDFRIETLYSKRERAWQDLNPDFILPRPGILRIESRGKTRDAFGMTMAYVTDDIDGAGRIKTLGEIKKNTAPS